MEDCKEILLFPLRMNLAIARGIGHMIMDHMYAEVNLQEIVDFIYGDNE